LGRHHTTHLCVETQKMQPNDVEEETPARNSPKTALPDIVRSRKEEENSAVKMKNKGGSAGIETDKLFKERKSLFSKQREVQDITENHSIEEGINDPSVYNTTTASREADQKIHLDLTKCSFENRDNSHSNDKIHTVTHFPTQGAEYSPASEPLSKRKAQTLVLDVSGVPKQVENLLEEGCKNSFLLNCVLNDLCV